MAISLFNWQGSYDSAGHVCCAGDGLWGVLVPALSMVHGATSVPRHWYNSLELWKKQISPVKFNLAKCLDLSFFLHKIKKDGEDLNNYKSSSLVPSDCHLRYKRDTSLYVC